MGWRAGLGLAFVSALSVGLMTPAAVLAQSTPSPAVQKLIEGRLAEFDALTKEVDAAGDDQAKLTAIAAKMAAAVKRTYADYQELDDDWNADQKKMVVTYGKDTGNDIMTRFAAAAAKVDAVVAKTDGTSGCTECDELFIVPGCQLRCCKGDKSPAGSTYGATPYECPPVEQKTCSHPGATCPQ